jgi:hypothetical protein
MKSKITSSAAIAAVLVFMSMQAAQGFPIGVSIHGGLGKGFYSMEGLNDYINELRLDFNANLADLSSGTNVMLQGRIWLFDRIGFTANYEHFWGESEIQTLEGPVMFKAPGNSYSIGGIVKVLSLPRFVDFDLGINLCFANSVYGTNENLMRRLEEFKGSDNGYEAYIEAVSNFVPPLEFGFMLGYRGLQIKDFEDRYGDIGYFDEDQLMPIAIDYSGVFLYVTAGIGL